MNQQPQKISHAHRGGFTLVEMLVSTVLVVMIMLMFATVFQLAAGAMSRQKGMAENDERARMLTTVIRNDLHNRTFVNVIPWDAGESTANDAPNRRGYFYISENDPNNDTDDVFQLTIDTTRAGTAADAEPLYGKATSLGPEANQPEMDDGLSGNDTGASPVAEVSYFLRSNGNLYRRVLLLRTPYDETGAEPAVPPFATGAYSGSFWRDFDYSAFYKDLMTGDGMGLNTYQSLDNTLPASQFPIAIPVTRFGHLNSSTMLPDPREYDSDGDFFGRFTKQETSSDTPFTQFGYPGNQTNNPFDPATPVDLDPATGLVTEYADEPVDRGADILLSNVHSFDVKVYDDALGKFMDVGHTDSGGGNYNHSQNQQTDYGTNPNSALNNIFDTWHPEVDLENPYTPNAASLDPPPFRPVDGGGNAIPLKAIQITIRFFDVSSNQMRQLTIVHSLVNSNEN